MPKKTALATIPIKITVTPDEFALIEQARNADDERKTGTWVRKAALRAARAVLSEAAHPAKRGK